MSLQGEDTTPDPLVHDDITHDEEAMGGGLGVGVKQKKLAVRELSTMSRNYDIGNKGYLDDDEQMMREFDADGDGKFSLAEAKKMAHAIGTERALKEKETARKQLFKKIACFTGSAFAAQLIVMFALMWTL